MDYDKDKQWPFEKIWNATHKEAMLRIPHMCKICY